MKLAKAENYIESNGLQKAGAFQIEASSKAFQILSSSLYKNKVRAIIRELSCNARDAQVEANNPDAQFLVKLPSSIDPEFFIRDYGTGISEENIYSIYRTYFRSTKTNSNDFVGCLGLGSKTPFSYTNTFIVTSYYQGKEYIFVAYIDEEGTPNIAKMNEAGTSEPNGLKVSFAVKNEDIRDFVYEAEKVYKFFDKQPKVVGNGSYREPDTSKRTMITKRMWFDHNGQIGTIQIVMGNICYPIRSEDFPNIDKELFNYKEPITLLFDIGEVTFTPSREALENTAKNAEVIAKRLQHFKKLVLEKVSRDVNESNLKCIMDGAKFVKNYFAKNPGFHKKFVEEFLLDKVKRKVKGFKSPLFNPNLYDLTYSTYAHIELPIKLMANLNITKLKSKGSGYHKNLNLTLDTSDFVIDDLERGGKSRIRHHNKNNRYQLTLIQNPDPILLRALRRRYLGNLPIQKTSELVVPEKSEQTKREKAAFFVPYKISDRKYAPETNWKNRIGYPKNTKLVYIPHVKSRNYNGEEILSDIASHELHEKSGHDKLGQEIYFAIEKTGYTPVATIRSMDEKIKEHYPNAISLFEWLTEKYVYSREEQIAIVNKTISPNSKLIDFFIVLNRIDNAWKTYANLNFIKECEKVKDFYTIISTSYKTHPVLHFAMDVLTPKKLYDTLNLVQLSKEKQDFLDYIENNHMVLSYAFQNYMYKDAKDKMMIQYLNNQRK